MNIKFHAYVDHVNEELCSSNNGPGCVWFPLFRPTLPDSIFSIRLMQFCTMPPPSSSNLVLPATRPPSWLPVSLVLCMRLFSWVFIFILSCTFALSPSLSRVSRCCSRTLSLAPSTSTLPPRVIAHCPRVRPRLPVSPCPRLSLSFVGVAAAVAASDPFFLLQITITIVSICPARFALSLLSVRRSLSRGSA